MAIETFYDRVKVAVSGTPGTGSVTLGGAVTGYRSFAAAGVPDGATVSYVIEDGTSWEVGRGVYTSSGTSLARTDILESSAGGTTAISATSAAIVFLTVVAQDLADITAAIASGAASGIPTGRGSGDPHKAWRITALSTEANDGPTGISEVTMAHASGGSNIAFGTGSQTPFASSTETGRDPSQAFDQNTTTLWGSAPASAFPQFVGIIFASKQVVTQVQIQASSDGYWVHRAPLNFNVEWSDDTTNGMDGTWNTAFSEAQTTAYGAAEIRTFLNSSPTYGTNGDVVPAGGTAGQVLAKVDSTDYYTTWVAPGIADAPSNSVYYTRRNGVWVAAPSSSGGSDPGFRPPTAAAFSTKEDPSAVVTLTDTSYGLIFDGGPASSSGVDIRMAGKTPPSATNWYAILGVKIAARPTNYLGLGLGIMGAGGQFVSLITLRNTTPQLEVDEWTSRTAFNSNAANDTDGFPPCPIYMRVDWEGSAGQIVWSYGPSPDCLNIMATTPISFLTTATLVGAFTNAQQGSGTQEAKMLITYYADTDNP